MALPARQLTLVNEVLPHPPYPPDTKTRGWRFYIDHERLEGSDTWALAGKAGLEIRPWLLMMWLAAWKETPMGSLPQQSEIIAAKMGMSHALFVTHGEVMLRNWVLHSDGRLYHHVITEQVLARLAYREKGRLRKALQRGSAELVPSMSRGTHMGRTRTHA